MKKKRWPLRIALFLGALALLIGLAVLFVVTTRPGARLTMDVVRGYLPDGMTFGEVTGPLNGPLEVRDIDVTTATAHITVGRVAVDWRLRGILRRRVVVDQLAIEDVRVIQFDTVTAPVEETVIAPLAEMRFPVAVEFRSADVRNVRIERPDTAVAPFVVDSVHLAADLLRDGLRVDQLHVYAPLGRIDASADVTTTGAYPVRARVAFDVALRDSLRSTGKLALDGDIEGTLTVSTTLRSPVLAELDAKLKRVRYGAWVDAEIRVPDQQVTGLAEGMPALRTSSRLTARGPIDSLAVGAEIDVDAEPVGPVHGSIRLLWLQDSLLIDRVAITGAGDANRTTSVELGGRVLIDSVPSFNVEVAWQDLAWPLEGPPAASSPTGRVVLSGTPDDWSAHATASVANPALDAVSMVLDATGTRTEARLLRLEARTTGASAAARGTVAWAPAMAWQLDIAADSVAPAAFLPDPELLPGLISLNASTRGRAVGDGMAGRFELRSLRGVLREREVRGRAAIGFAIADAMSFDVDELALEWGNASARASGSVGEQLGLRVDVDVPDLGIALADAGGTVRLAADVTGSRTTPRLAGTASAVDVRYGDMSMDRLASDFDVSPAADGNANATLRIGRVVSGTRSLDSASLSLRGSAPDHVIAFTVAAGDSTRLALNVTGGYAENTWSGRIQQFDAHLPIAGAWTIDRDAGLTASPRILRLEPLCLASDPARLCLEGARDSTGAVQARVSLADFGLGRLAGFVPVGWSLDGTFGFNMQADVDAEGTILASLDADAGNARVVFPVGDLPDTLNLSTATLRGSVDEGGGQIGLEVIADTREAAAAARLSADLRMSGLRNVKDSIPALPVEGRITGLIEDFSIVSAMNPLITSPAGRLTIDTELAGTAGAPVFRGGLALTDGRAEIPSLGLSIVDAHASARGEDADVIRFEAGASSGDGRVEIAGTTTLGEAGPKTSMSIRGTRFLAMNTPEIHVWASPELDVTATSERIDVTGNVHLPRADIELTEVPHTAVAPSRDVVFVGDTAAASGPAIGARIRITLGDSISFSGFGFTAPPTGSLLVIQEPPRAPTGTGEISLEGGRFRAYGQDLTLERGRVFFAGPVADPGLDMRAIRTADDGTIAGLEILGTLSEPDIRLFSEPAMTQSEALAYIVLGHPLGQASEQEGDMLSNAATSLGLKGGNLLAGRIASRFGLSELRLESDGPLDDASLVAGRYLSPRLYVSYGVGLFKPVSTYRVRFLLSSRWTLQAESGDVSSADLLYRLERGR